MYYRTLIIFMPQRTMEEEAKRIVGSFCECLIIYFDPEITKAFFFSGNFGPTRLLKPATPGGQNFPPTTLSTSPLNSKKEKSYRRQNLLRDFCSVFWIKLRESARRVIFPLLRTLSESGGAPRASQVGQIDSNSSTLLTSLFSFSSLRVLCERQEFKFNS